MTPRAALDWCLAAVAFFSPLSIAGTNASLGVLTLCVMRAWHDRVYGPELRRSVRETLLSPAFILLAASTLWFGVSALAGLEPRAALSLLPKELHKPWAFVVLAAALAAARRAPALQALALGLGLHAAFGVSQSLTAGAETATLVRAHGFLHPVSFGGIMGLGLAGICAYLARTPAGERGRPYAAALAALVGAAVAVNQTRAIAAALGAAALVAALASARPRRALTGAFLALVAVLAFWEFIPTGGRNLRTLFSKDPRAAGHRVRLTLWDAALAMSRERPLTGVGPGGYRAAFERAHPDRLDPERSWGSAHNLFLHQLAERGVPGLLLLLALFTCFLRGAWRAARTARDAAGLWSLTAAAAFFVMNLTENAWQVEQVATFFLLAWLWGAGPRHAPVHRTP